MAASFFKAASETLFEVLLPVPPCLHLNAKEQIKIVFKDKC